MMYTYYTSLEETQEERIARLAKIKTNDKLVKSYSAVELDALWEKFFKTNCMARKILFDAYIDYLLLIGMTQDEASFYVDYVNMSNELSIVEKVEEIEWFFLEESAHAQISESQMILK